MWEALDRTLKSVQGKPPHRCAQDGTPCFALLMQSKDFSADSFRTSAKSRGGSKAFLQEVLLLSYNLAAELMSHVELCAAFLMQSSCQALPHDDCTVGATASVVEASLLNVSLDYRNHWDGP